MSLSEIIIGILVVGIIWGGFIYFIIKAIKLEKKKSDNYGKENITINQ